MTDRPSSLDYSRAYKGPAREEGSNRVFREVLKSFEAPHGAQRCRDCVGVAEGMSSRYDPFMVAPGNLADPDFEPSDEDLIGLSRRAFADVRVEHERVLEKLRLEIAARRTEVLLRLADSEKTP